MTILIPQPEELQRWILHTAQHSCHVEYYLKELGIGHEDPERPHDIVGEGNKFQEDVMPGFAMWGRDRSQEHFNTVVLPSLTKHRCQFHHRMWNPANDQATPCALKLGAVDAICSLLEPRDYQGGVHDFTQIDEIIAQNHEPTRRAYLTEVFRELRVIARPRLDLMTSLDDVRKINVGLHVPVHDAIAQRVEEARRQVKQLYGYDI